MMFWYGDGASWWVYLLMAFSMVLFWALIIAGVVALVRYVGWYAGGSPQQAQQTRFPPPEQPAPERVLAERFARGEIEEDEYRRRLDALRTGGA